MRTAPYHSDVTYGPKPNSAEWIDAADGKRLRMVSWSGGKKGTILLFQGRTEYAEKYGEVVQQLLDRGMSVATCDWRGQGLSERYARHYQIGEVDDFSDYQYDVEALMSFAKKKRLPKPYIALGHSLGGGILLRALHNGLDVKAAIFSSPMWGIQVPSVLKPFASFIVTLYRALGIADRLAPGRRLENYVDYQGFEGNTLTHDLREWNTLRRQVVSHPEFGLGGPSVNWVDLALRDGDALAELDAPDVPALAVYAGNEKIVRNDRIEAITAKWPKAKAYRVEGAEHEVLMESSEMRRQVWDQVTAFLDSHTA